ncbi:hypothetical protein AZI87_00115 [Bdellovibrio bacteriovorus]|uniref:Uncharacterized protein n=1 Tax=Bdellovibrio bacteriovorus TaxID=959 RepID=A0A162GBF8_BDEBC|nr:hypothetical protein [Bdellovibrio bacteriovorus]KYG67727.1 hypothetical protein AZI87_00115 [Bdellovibrio bacteriovorus]
MKYQYYLFNPRILTDETAKLTNQVYETWKQVYDGIFESLHTDDFYRNEVITCLKDVETDEVLAFHMYSVFDDRASSHLEHRYMEPFTPELVKKFQAEGAHTYMSLEYLGVNTSYQLSKPGFKVADIISALSMKAFEASPWDGLLAVARMDYKIHEKAQRFGMRPMGEIMRGKYPCQLLFLKKTETKELSDPFLAKMVNELWNAKINHTDLISDQPVKKRHLKIA